MLSRSRTVLVIMILIGGLLGHWASAHEESTQLAQSSGSSNSGGGNSGNSSANSNGDSGTSNNNGSSGPSSDGGSGPNGGGGDGGTGGTTPLGGGTTPPGGGTAPTVGANPASTIPADRVEPAKPANCPDDAGVGARCFRITPGDNSAGARLPDGRVVALPPGPTVNIDSGASTSNDVDQVIVIQDNRVIDRRAVGNRVGQWLLATVGLLLLVLIAVGVGAAIYRAGVREGRDKA